MKLTNEQRDAIGNFIIGVGVALVIAGLCNVWG